MPVDLMPNRPGERGLIAFLGAADVCQSPIERVGKRCKNLRNARLSRTFVYIVQPFAAMANLLCNQVSPRRKQPGELGSASIKPASERSIVHRHKLEENVEVL